MSAPVGADIESICGKCGDVWHVVVAKVGEQIARVLCKQCGAQHRHRPPGSAAKIQRRASAGAARPARAPRVGAPQPQPEPVAFDPSRPPRPYRADDAFLPGERIVHSVFGVGVVQSVAGPGKIHVAFPTGPRVLAQAKPPSTLAPPGPRPPPDDEEEE